MAKDPAFLFFPDNWQGGTSTMSRHLKGCYLDLLLAQFNTGPLTIEEIRTVLGTDFAAWQGSLSKKFAVDETGKYFNERLEKEKLKRQEFAAMQKERAVKGWEKRHLLNSGNAGALPVGNRNTSLGLLAVQNKKELLENQFFHEDVCQKIQVSMPYVLAKIKEFVNDREDEELQKSWAECRRHFKNWLKIQIAKNPPADKKLYTQRIIT